MCAFGRTFPTASAARELLCTLLSQAETTMTRADSVDHRSELGRRGTTGLRLHGDGGSTRVARDEPGGGRVVADLQARRHSDDLQAVLSVGGGSAGLDAQPLDFRARVAHGLGVRSLVMGQVMREVENCPT